MVFLISKTLHDFSEPMATLLMAQEADVAVFVSREAATHVAGSDLGLTAGHPLLPAKYDTSETKN